MAHLSEQLYKLFSILDFQLPTCSVKTPEMKLQLMKFSFIYFFFIISLWKIKLP